MIPICPKPGNRPPAPAPEFFFLIPNQHVTICGMGFAMNTLPFGP